MIKIETFPSLFLVLYETYIPCYNLKANKTKRVMFIN